MPAEPEGKMSPPGPAFDEDARLAALRATGLLDSPPDERFDRVTRFACELFGVEMALVSLVDEDRQWFKSRHGTEATHVPRDVSFCGHVVNAGEALVVDDASRDERFSAHPMVAGTPHLRFYAGWPLRTPEGHTLGTLCLLSSTPRQLSPEEEPILADLAGIVSAELSDETAAQSDPLTGLATRASFLQLGQQAVVAAARLERHVLGVLCVEPRLGPATSARRSEVLLTLGDYLDQAAAPHLVGRTGRHQLATLITAPNVEDLQWRRDATIDAITRALIRDGGEPLMLAVGWAQWDLDRALDLEDLLLEADAMVYGDPGSVDSTPHPI
jgi:GAF domain